MFAMKSLFSKSALALAVGLLAVTSAGCGELAPTYPREVEVVYRVTSDEVTGVNATYTNRTGGLSSVDGVELPYTVTVRPTIDRYDVFALSASGDGPGEMTLEIVVDGEVVETQSFSGDSFVHGSIVYMFE